MLKMIFFDEDPDEVLKEEDIRVEGTRSGGEVERIDFRDTEEASIYIFDFWKFVILLDFRSVLIYGFLKVNALKIHKSWDFV